MHVTQSSEHSLDDTDNTPNLAKQGAKSLEPSRFFSEFFPAQVIPLALGSCISTESKQAFFVSVLSINCSLPPTVSPFFKLHFGRTSMKVNVK